MTKAHNDFLNHGHALSSSCWSAWWTAYQYAVEVDSPLLGKIARGCDYAEAMKPIPRKYFEAADKLWHQAMDAVATIKG